jgi:LysR family hydrogen peroxide-inducible transcriptional activator
LRALVKLADEGLGTTLLPFTTLDLKESDKLKNLDTLKNPNLLEEVSLIYLKIEENQIIDALEAYIIEGDKNTCFQNV